MSTPVASGPVRAGRRSAVSIGVYDGLHRGHMRVLALVTGLARREGLESVVVTFDRHPASVVRPESAPLQLTDLPQRIELLHAAGVDNVRVIEFTPERAAESAEEFVEEVLVRELAAEVVVVGRDFHFGKGRGGDVALLEKMGAAHGFRVELFELVTDERGAVVSSTRIRTLIAESRLAEAAALLGRPHEVRGLVTGEAAGFSGAGAGSAGAEVAVPAEILLPPPGGYRARAGLVGAAGLPLEECHVVVPAKQGGLVVIGLSEPPASGSPLRVLFEKATLPGEL